MSPTIQAAIVRFDPKAAKSIHDWQHSSMLLCCRVDPKGKYVMAGGIDHTIQRWEIATGTKTALLGHDNWVRMLGFSPDGATLYSSGYDGRLIFWEVGVQTPKPSRTIQAHQGWVRGLAVSTDGKRLATCGNDKMVRIWSGVDGKMIQEMKGHPNIPYCLQFVPGSHDLVSGDIVGNIHHWHGADGRLVRKLDATEIHNMIGDIAPFGGIINLVFSSEAKVLVATGLHKTTNAPGGERRPVAIPFDWVSGKKLPKKESIKKEFNGTLWRALFHPNGILVGVMEKQIGFWKPEENDAFHLLVTPSEIYDCDLHPNQVELYTAHHDGHVRCHQFMAI
jgi:WD40 repeat protein